MALLIDPLLHSMHRMGLSDDEQLQQLREHGAELTPTKLYSERVRLGLIEPKRSEAWTADEDEELRALSQAKGVSHQDISDILFEKFGTIRSKGSVIGRFHRLGLAKPRAKAIKPEPTLKPEPQKQPVKKPGPVFIDPEIFTGEGKPLNERACRWPLSVVNGTQTYCGCTLHRKSYCEHHYGIAYQAA